MTRVVCPCCKGRKVLESYDPSGGNAFMEFLNTVRAQKESAEDAVRRFEAFAERWQNELQAVRAEMHRLASYVQDVRCDVNNHFAKMTVVRIVEPPKALPDRTKHKTKPKTKRRTHR
jgi:hypothetical protein